MGGLLLLSFKKPFFSFVCSSYLSLRDADWLRPKMIDYMKERIDSDFEVIKKKKTKTKKQASLFLFGPSSDCIQSALLDMSDLSKQKDWRTKYS